MSQVFKADDEALVVEFKGEKHEVRLPSHAEIEGYRKKMGALKEDEASEALFDFLEQLGLKREVSTQLTHRKLILLVGALTDVEKKS